jgi:glycosyltransferase involved in cell wall biosynthesis
MPPVITGQSLVTECLYNILKKHHADIQLITLDEVNKGIISKFIKHVFFVTKVAFVVLKSDSVVYLPGARSTLGFFRNAYVIILSKLFNHKIVVHFHCGDYNEFILEKGPLFVLITKWIFRKIDYLIILSETLSKNYDLLYNDNMKVVVIPNGISIDVNLKKSIFQSGDINILFLSNLIESKGYLDLLEAIRILVNEYGLVNIRCNFCGNFLESSDDQIFKNKVQALKYFNAFIQKNNLTQNVLYKGLVSGLDKSIMLENSDIFILPTYYSTEAQPFSILEAMSYGKVVIATAHRAIPDMIIDNHSGILIPSKSPQSIANAVIRTINNKKLQQKLSENAIYLANNNYSLVQFELNSLNFFKKLEVVN